MKFTLALASLSASLLPSVLGHGHMTTLTVDGKDYTGPVPNAAPIDSVIRQINSINPIDDVTSSAMSCGNGAANVTATQSAAGKPPAPLPPLLILNSHVNSFQPNLAARSPSAGSPDLRQPSGLMLSARS